MTEAGRILVVEDDEFVCNSLKWLLTDEGYQVKVAVDGRRALAMIGAEAAYDLVITDLRMPDVDGLAVLKQVKAVSPDTPVIVLTGYGTVEAAVSALEEGAFDFLTKPCDDLEMKFKIINALEMKRLQTELRRLQTVTGRHGALLDALGDALSALAGKSAGHPLEVHLKALAESMNGHEPCHDEILARCRQVLERLKQSGT